jgi:(+)-delta-cadinene 8-hydroxylase
MESGKAQSLMPGLLRYTEATILEAQRLASAVPLNGSNRVNYQEMTIDGYLIPAKSSIAVNLFAIHRDPQYWPEALQFKPERFIEPVTKLIRIPAGFMPFGIGMWVIKMFCQYH